jgi:hypothetical protein
MAIRDFKERTNLLLEAEFHLNRSLIRCRSFNLVEFEPEILLAWAKWHFIKGNTNSANEDAFEALQIADRCDYRLNKADINNFLALLSLNSKDIESSIKYAKMAYDFALCDGISHCYKPAMNNSNIIMNSIKAKFSE